MYRTPTYDQYQVVYKCNIANNNSNSNNNSNGNNSKNNNSKTNNSIIIIIISSLNNTTISKLVLYLLRTFVSTSTSLESNLLFLTSDTMSNSVPRILYHVAIYLCSYCVLLHIEV